MNTVFFSCAECKVFVDAGYRHACSTLELPGVVQRSQPVNVQAVMRAREYWNSSGGWFSDLLPVVRAFLETHSQHNVRFGDSEELDLPLMFASDEGNYALFDWLMEAGFVFQELPRYFVERLGFRKWTQVLEYVERLENPPDWWNQEESQSVGREKFLSLVVKS